MKKLKGPTDPQKTKLAQFKITDIPTTKEATSTLINYILNGNNSALTEPVERARFVRQWSQAKVKVINGQNPHRGQIGKVIGLQMRERREIAELAEQYPCSPIIPFFAIVQLNQGGKPVRIPTSALRIIKEDKRQRVLFDKPVTATELLKPIGSE